MFTTKEIARRLDRNPGTIRNWINKGLLPAKVISPHKKLVKMKDAKAVDRQHPTRLLTRGDNHPKRKARALPEKYAKTFLTPRPDPDARLFVNLDEIQTRLGDISTELFEIRKASVNGVSSLDDITLALNRLAEAWEGKK